jgi:chorismate mutase/prephenate dehydratase
MGDMEDLRSQIDGIDKRLVKLLNERAEAALEISKFKQAKGAPVYAPDREASVLEGAAGQGKGPLPPAAIRSIYREIISATRAMEKVVVVSYLGPAGTFTHQAARAHFGTAVQYVPSEDIEEVFQDVLKGKADVGVVPIENSTGGVVSETLDTFMTCGLKIGAEIILEIHQNLMGRCKIEEVKRVYSKPEAIAQCRRWLSEHLPHAELIPVASTTAAAQEAGKGIGVAAIASSEAAELYDLRILAENVEDHHENVTRFVVLGKKFGSATGHDRTSIVFAVKNRVGALYDMLLPFKHHGINLTKIESRPSRTKAWDYIFFVDLEGHVEDAEVKAALAEVEEGCRYFQLMGSYPRADARE